MESIIVGVLVGVIVGGASTWLSHNFDRWRRREIREEERHSNLREMLETMSRLARAQASGLVEYEMAMINDALEPREGHPHVEEARVRQLDYVRGIEQRHPSFLWRPWRIDDPSLLGLAGSLQDANTAAAVLMGDALRGEVKTMEEWWSRSRKATAAIETVLRQVDERLDKLGW
jgi:hypothetical protein